MEFGNFAYGIQNPGNFCSWNPESGKFLLVESGIREILPVESGVLGFGIRNIALRIGNPTNDWNPESKFH